MISKKNKDEGMTPEEIKDAVNKDQIVCYKDDNNVVTLTEDTESGDETWAIVDIENDESQPLFDETNEDFVDGIEEGDFYLMEDEPIANADGDEEFAEQPMEDLGVEEEKEDIADIKAEASIDAVQTQLDTLYEQVETLRNEVKRLLEENGELEGENTSIKEELASTNKLNAEIEINSLLKGYRVTNKTRDIITGIYIEDKNKGIELIKAISNSGVGKSFSTPRENLSTLRGDRITGTTLAERVASFKKMPKG